MRTAWLCLLLFHVYGASAAHAQPPERVVLFKTASDDASLAELAAALDPVIGSGLDEATTVTVAARAAVDLPGLQLAIDCVGETADCLRAAAGQSEAESLLAPSVRSQGDEIIVRLLHWNPSLEPQVRTVERRFTGERTGEQALASVRPMLAELFPDPTPEPDTSEPASEPTPTAIAPPPLAADAPPDRARGLPPLPLVLGGVGVALIGTGVVFGVMSGASEDAYRDIRPSETSSTRAGRAEVDRAQAQYDTAKTQGTVANVLYGLGAGVLVGAGVLFYWQMKERGSERRVSVEPQLGPGTAVLTLTAWSHAL